MPMPNLISTIAATTLALTPSSALLQDKDAKDVSADTPAEMEVVGQKDVPAPPPATKTGGKPVAVFFMRQSVVPRAGDEEHLKKGLSLMIASTSGGMTIVEFGVKDGQITWKATSGSVDKKTAKKIDKAVAKLQKHM